MSCTSDPSFDLRCSRFVIALIGALEARSCANACDLKGIVLEWGTKKAELSVVEISQACKPAGTESHCASDLPVLPNIPLGEKHDVNHFLSMSFCRLHAQWISRLKTQDSALTCKRCLQLARSMEQGTCFHPVECILAVQDSQSQSCFHRSMLYFRDICLRASNVSQIRQNHRKQNQVSPEAHHIENHHIE